MHKDDLTDAVYIGDGHFVSAAIADEIAQKSDALVKEAFSNSEGQVVIPQKHTGVSMGVAMKQSVSTLVEERLLSEMRRLATARELDFDSLDDEAWDELEGHAMPSVEKFLSEWLEETFSDAFSETLEVPVSGTLPVVNSSFAKADVGILIWRDAEGLHVQRVRPANMALTLQSGTPFRPGTMKSCLFSLLREGRCSMSEMIDAFKEQGHIPKDMEKREARTRMSAKLGALKSKCPVVRDDEGKYYIDE